jgi:hypothetical protein
MGFWGTYIVARADQSLPGLPALRDSAGEISWHGRRRAPQPEFVAALSPGAGGAATRRLPSAACRS